MRPLLTLFLVLLPLNLTSAKTPTFPSGVQTKEITTYDLTRLSDILTTELKDFSDFPVEYPTPNYPVKLYRLVYPSVIPEQQNRPTVASGLIAVPQGCEGILPVVSYQHGTVFTKTAVPSRPEESMETRLIIATFAAQGYIVVAPDYFGKGDSPETDSYIVKASTQQACLDNLYAAKAASEKLNLTWGPLFVSGWSQGGWATLAFLNKLESIGIPVAGAAVSSGPSDIYATVNAWIHATRDIDAGFLPAALCIQIHALSEYHGLPGLPATAIRPEYLEIAHNFYLNKITWDEAYSKLPGKAINLFRDEFLDVNSPISVRYWEILDNSQSYRWRSATPMRVFYGQIDEVVSPYLASLPVGFQQAVGGAETVAIDAGEKANHRGTFLYGIANQQKWFEELRKNGSVNPKPSAPKNKAPVLSTPATSGSGAPAVP